jgi:superfamily II DNA or RNA helicase
MRAHEEIELRDYQRECINAIWHAWPNPGMPSIGVSPTPGTLRPAVVMPTGSGKTIMFSALARDFLEIHGERVLVLVHRDELADQAIAKIRATAPTLTVGKVKAADNEVSADVVVASVQTISRDNRLRQLVDAHLDPARPRFGLIITDECHHAAAASYGKIYDAFPYVKQAGFTATMARGDGVGLGDVWEKVVYQRSVLEMVADGYLTDVRGRSIDLEGLDLSQVKMSGKDYSAASLGDAMMSADGPRLIARVMHEHARDRRSVVFTPTVAMAHATAKELDAVGIPAGVVSGETPREERQRIYNAAAAGKLRALVNCMVLTEGFDLPALDCCVIARPTKSAPLFVQMAGRVLRPWPGKTEALVIDITGAGGVLSTLVDLAPGQVTQMRQGESLAEAYEEQEARANTRVEAGSLAFRLKHKELDLFTASSPNWLRTRGGVLFIPIQGGYIVLWPARDGDPGHWDVWGVPENHGKFMPLHRGLPLGTAHAWAETEARDNAQFSVERKADWRRKPAAPRMVALARSMRLDVGAGARAGDVSDLMAVHKASLKLDHLLERLEQ